MRRSFHAVLLIGFFSASATFGEFLDNAFNPDNANDLYAFAMQLYEDTTSLGKTDVAVEIFNEGFPSKGWVGDLETHIVFSQDELGAVARLAASFIRRLGERMIEEYLNSAFFLQQHDYWLTLDRCYAFSLYFNGIVRDQASYTDADRLFTKYDPFDRKLPLPRILANADVRTQLFKVRNQPSSPEQRKQLARLVMLGITKDLTKGAELDCVWNPIDYRLGIDQL